MPDEQPHKEVPDPGPAQGEMVTRQPGRNGRSTRIHDPSIVPRPANCFIHPRPARPRPEPPRAACFRPAPRALPASGQAGPSGAKRGRAKRGRAKPGQAGPGWEGRADLGTTARPPADRISDPTYHGSRPLITDFRFAKLSKSGQNLSEIRDKTSGAVISDPLRGYRSRIWVFFSRFRTTFAGLGQITVTICPKCRYRIREKMSGAGKRSPSQVKVAAWSSSGLVGVEHAIEGLPAPRRVPRPCG